MSKLDLCGQPLRYVYKAHKNVIYVENEDGYTPLTRYMVEFELACDRMDMEHIDEDHYVANPYIVNVQESGAWGDEGSVLVSHAVMLTEKQYDVLASCSVLRPRLSTYAGVVNGYKISDLRILHPNEVFPETGLYIADEGVYALTKPTGLFSETKHKRYVQKSKAFLLKLNKKSS